MLNAALTAYGMRPGLNLGARGDIDVVYGIYLLEERLVWAPRPEASDWFGLVSAPHDANEFVALCDLLAACERVQTLLDRP